MINTFTINCENIYCIMKRQEFFHPVIYYPMMISKTVTIHFTTVSLSVFQLFSDKFSAFPSPYRSRQTIFSAHTDQIYRLLSFFLQAKMLHFCISNFLFNFTGFVRNKVSTYFYKRNTILF